MEKRFYEAMNTQIELEIELLRRDNSVQEIRPKSSDK
jgi:hypothetical protein